MKPKQIYYFLWYLYIRLIKYQNEVESNFQTFWVGESRLGLELVWKQYCSLIISGSFNLILLSDSTWLFTTIVENLYWENIMLKHKFLFFFIRITYKIISNKNSIYWVKRLHCFIYFLKCVITLINCNFLRSFEDAQRKNGAYKLICKKVLSHIIHPFLCPEFGLDIQATALRGSSVYLRLE